jgi:hypothetical protein
MLIKLGQPTSVRPLVPTGLLIKTGSKLGHESVAGPLAGNRQVVGHKEPGIGTLVEFIDIAAQRYRFTEVQPPLNDVHGVISWSRMEQQVGDRWGAFDNCQHAARKAYYGRPASPAVAGLAVGAAGLLLLWLANRD